MTLPLRVCPVCTGEWHLGGTCPTCGYEELREPPEICLPAGTLLHGEYAVGNPLGMGGFGITYLAWHRTLARPVAIKEYLPTKLAGRAQGRRTVKSHSLNHETDFRFGITQFLKEARLLAQLSHPNIVQVRDGFEENGTAYLVMEYHAGHSLDQLLKERGGRLPEAEAVKILEPILDALQYVHGQGKLHCDIKPANIYLREDGTPLLLDFGAARSALEEQTRTLQWVTHGYAAYEQYHTGDQPGAWTDVYGAAATLYKLVTGDVPPNAMKRKRAIERGEEDALKPPEELAPEVSPIFSQAVLSGLAIQAEQRPQNVGELCRLLNPPSVVQNHPPSTPRMRSKKRPVLAPGAVAVTLGVAYGLWQFLKKRSVLVAGAVVVALGVIFGLWMFLRKQPTFSPSKDPSIETPSVAAFPSHPKPEDIHRNNMDGLQYIWIPPGMFQMGCRPKDWLCDTDERPRHLVNITKGFWLGETEVTVAAYRRFAKGTGRILPSAPSFDPNWEKDNHPIVNVTWDDARAFCQWAVDGRLPSEAEWEYAARGGREGEDYPWGSQRPVCRYGAKNGAKFDDNAHCDSTGTEPIRSYAPNGYGFYDMVGNVWEWCEDMWHDSYQGAPRDGSAWLNGNPTLRVFRGGAWSMNAANLRVSGRSKVATNYPNNNVGFRCVRP